VSRPRRAAVFSRRDNAVLSAAEGWAAAMGPYPRELTPEAADVGAAMYQAHLPGRSAESIRAAFRAVAARETARIEASS